MYFKKLIGKKCYLSPIDVNDAEIFTEWLNDMVIIINLELYSSIISLENEKAFLNNLSNDHNYSIIDMETEKIIGNCGFQNVDYVNQTAEAGIFIGDKSFWNKGYGTEALSLLADYGFKALNFHNIMLRVYEYNKKAIRCYEKTGFKQIGKRRGALLRNLERHNIVFMDLLRDEFYDLPKQERGKI
jgi:RimJ/RimL family protein N-acetyltransferase